ncbi:MAG: aspartate--tRNA(Asn) ligase [Nocardioidaceae bacterium]|nr:aspartate--tRNA(Asn) ligase [Nocardioidaceae bacterium]
MGRTMTDALAPGARVTVQGWVHRRRTLAGVTFVVLRDRTGLAQVVVKDPATIREVAGYGEETVVSVTGTVLANPVAPGGVEVVDPRFETLTDPAETPPVQLWRPTPQAGLPTLLDHAPVALRHPRLAASWRLAAASMHGFRSALSAAGFTEVQTPKLVEMSTESGANVFTVDYFGRPAYLAQSPQLYKQVLVGVFERVFEVGPVFRAEQHDTLRHVAEYVSLDAEVGFVRDHRDVIAVLREALAGMVAAVRERAASAVGLLDVRLPVVPEEIPVVHFRDALRIAGAPPDEPDLAPEHERALSAWALAELGSELLAVEGYPMRKRPFYTHPQTVPEPDPQWSNSFDVLFRGLELTTGGQRLHRYADYRAALAASGQDEAAYAGYLEAFRHGMPPHGGFAIGLERWVARLTGASNIREVTLFPRDLHRLSP